MDGTQHCQVFLVPALAHLYPFVWPVGSVKCVPLWAFERLGLARWMAFAQS
jgi:hypothetical protein